MGGRARRAFAAAGASAVVALAAGCGSSGPAAPAAQPPLPQAHLVALTKHDLPLLADLTKQKNGHASMGTPTLVVDSTAGSALLSFDVGDLDFDCLGSASLHVPAVTADVPVLAYVSLETGVADLPDGANLGAAVIAQASPSEPSATEAGGLTWDVDSLLRWNHANQAKADTFVVALKPRYPDGTATKVELGASESGRGGRLTVTDKLECSKPA